MSFDALFQPGKIGNMQLKNRFVLAPMGTYLCDENGFVTKRAIEYYVARARGEVGLLITEGSYARKEGYTPHRLRVDRDDFVPALRELTDSVHLAGAKIVMQLNTRRGREDADDPVCASDVPVLKSFRGAGLKPRILNEEDILKLVGEMRDGAARAKRAGFDGVMIHGAHGYAITEFLSPLTNKRTDKYGGSLENRARFALEQVAAIKDATGNDYPLLFRLTCDEHLENGFSIDDAIIVCQMLERAGVDAIDVVSGSAETSEWVVPPMCIPRGYNVPLAEKVKKAVGIPVMVAGRINDPYIANDIVRGNKADFIDLGRALLADPEFCKKTRAGQTNDIRKCIACDDCMNLKLRAVTKHINCSVNPFSGREGEITIRPTLKSKNILVVGGGPGGMEAATIAASRGHKVTLWERDSKLGGNINLAVIPPNKEELRNITDFLQHQLFKLGIKVEFEKEATVESILKFKPDAVILATGSNSRIPDIPGIKGKRVVSAVDVLKSQVHVGSKVIVIGGGSMGCETAEFLAERNKKVTIVEILKDIANEASDHERWFLLPSLQAMGIRIKTNVTPKEIRDDGVVIADSEGVTKILKADTVVIAIGFTPNNELEAALRGKFSDVYSVGDCGHPGRIRDAIMEGTKIGLSL